MLSGIKEYVTRSQKRIHFYLSVLFDSSTIKLITEKLSKTGFIRQIALQLLVYPLAPSVGVAKALLLSKQTLFAAGTR